MNFERLLQGASKPGFNRWKLNVGLWKMIPFNYPHRLKLSGVTDTEVHVKIPFIRKNKNHVGTVHACCQATAAEYSSGMSILRHFSPKEYRLLMQNISVEYTYQAKTACVTKAIMLPERVQELKEVISKEGKTLIVQEINCYDTEGNIVSITRVNWQIKAWAKVKSK